MGGSESGDESSARRKLNPSRLQDQIFASTAVDPAEDVFNEYGLPYILRFVYDGISRKVILEPCRRISRAREGLQREEMGVCVCVFGEGSE